MRKALVNGRVFDGQGLSSGLAVILVDGVVSELLPEGDMGSDVDVCWDLEGHILSPGLIDIQVNGGGGVMFNDAPTVETIRTMGAAHRQFGTTGFLPTLISTDPGTMKQAIRAVDEAISLGVPGVLGIHLEGPYLNANKRGIHHAERFGLIDETAFELLTSLSRGSTLVTIAPELASSNMIARLVEAGVVVFGGHSAASYQQASEALQAGMSGFTHLFNAMSAFESREPGMVGAALEDKDSWFGIIADGQHVHPAAVSVAIAAKRKGYALLVTDAMASVGSDVNTFNFDGREIEAVNGCCRTLTGELAGSDLDMLSAVRNVMQFTGMDMLEALRMASSYPAKTLGLEDRLGLIRPGFDANFIEIDDELSIYRSWIGGEVST